MKTEKIILSLLFIIIGFNQLKAQDKSQGESEVKRQKPTGYIALNVGVETPTGSFSKTDIGGALSGNAYQLSVCAPYGNSYFSFGAKLNYGNYTMTNQPFYTQQQAIIRKIGVDTSVKFSPNIKQNYIRTSVLIGLYGTLPIITDDRLSLDTRVLFGPSFITRPELNISFTDKNNMTKSFSQASSKSTTFAYDLGFSVRYNLLKSHKLCLMLSFDYLATKGNFEVQSNSRYYTDANVLMEGVHTEKIVYTFTSYDITGGIGYVW